MALKLKLKHLKLKGFRWVQDNDLFEISLDHFNLIQGDNFKGKTTIGIAIVFAFYGCDLSGSPQVDYLINKDSSSSRVYLTFELNGQEHHLIRVRSARSHDIYLDGQKVNQETINNLIGDKDLFLSLFYPSYLTEVLKPNDAREILIKLVPDVTIEEIKQMVEHPEYIQEVNWENYVQIVSATKNALEQNKTKIANLQGRLQELNFVSSIENEPLLVFDKEEELTSLQAILNDLKNNPPSEEELIVLNRQREAKLALYHATKAKIKDTSHLVVGSSCDSCGQIITKESLKKIQANNQKYKLELQTIAQEGKNISEQIKEIETNKNNYFNRINELVDKINQLQQEKLKIEFKNEAIRNRQLELLTLNDRKNTLEQELNEEQDSLNYLNQKLQVLKQIKILYLQQRLQKFKNYLGNDYDIKLFKQTKTTGEIKPTLEFLYKGREYRTLSRSEQMEFNRHISEVIAELSQRNYPLFLDNMESYNQQAFPNSQFNPKRQYLLAQVVSGLELRIATEEAVADFESIVGL